LEVVQRPKIEAFPMSATLVKEVRTKEVKKDKQKKSIINEFHLFENVLKIAFHSPLNNVNKM
jgi:hypothetical protein